MMMADEEIRMTAGAKAQDVVVMTTVMKAVAEVHAMMMTAIAVVDGLVIMKDIPTLPSADGKAAMTAEEEAAAVHAMMMMTIAEEDHAVTAAAKAADGLVIQKD